MERGIAFMAAVAVLVSLLAPAVPQAHAAAQQTPFSEGDWQPALPPVIGLRSAASPERMAEFAVALDNVFGMAELRQIPLPVSQGSGGQGMRIVHTANGQRVYVHDGQWKLWAFDAEGNQIAQAQAVQGTMLANDDHVVTSGPFSSTRFSPDLVPSPTRLAGGGLKLLEGDHLWKQSSQSGPSVLVTRINVVTGEQRQWGDENQSYASLRAVNDLADGNTMLVRTNSGPNGTARIELVNDEMALPETVATFPAAWISEQAELTDHHLVAYGTDVGSDVFRRRVIDLTDGSVLDSLELEANSYVETEQVLVGYDGSADAPGTVNFFDASTGEKRLSSASWYVRGTGSQQVTVSPDGSVLWVLKRLRDGRWGLVLASLEPQLIRSSQELYMPAVAPKTHLWTFNMAPVQAVLVNGESRPWRYANYRSDLSDLISVSLDPTDTALTATIEVVTADGTERLMLESSPERGQAALVLHLDDRERRRVAFAREWTYDVSVACDTLPLASRQFLEPVMVLVVPALEDCEVARTSSLRTGGWGFLLGDGPFERPFPSPVRAEAQFVSGGTTHLALTHDPGSQPMYIYVSEWGGALPGTNYSLWVECVGYESEKVTVAGGQGHAFEPPVGALGCSANVETSTQVEVGSITEFGVWLDRNRSRGYNPSSEGYVVFYADHGGTDIWDPVVVGHPGEGLGATTGAGAALVLPVDVDGNLTGQDSELIHQAKDGLGGAIESGDGFGTAIARGDFNADGWTDLAVGAPGEGIGALDGAGAVSVLYGSGQGFAGNHSQTISQNTSAVPGSAEAGDGFGWALAAVDFNGDGIIDLAVGAPGEDLGSIRDAGVVHVFYGSSSGLRTSESELFSQNSPGVESQAEAGDRFGQSLAASRGVLVVGSPDEAIGTVDHAGMIHLIDGLTLESQAYWQGRGTSGGAENGDRFGSTLAITKRWILIGVPAEDVGSVVDAGIVQVLGRSDDDRLGVRADRVLTQADFPRIGVAETNDNFGAAVALVPRTESYGHGFYFLVGAPGENAGRGVVHFGSMFSGAPVDERGTWQQGDGFFPGPAEYQHRLGEQVAFGARGSLLVSAPGQNFGAGAVFFAVTEWQELTQASPGISDLSEAGDRFGAALSG